ncbi:Major facilitator superfamily domain, general substrate transporter [Niveomyces insectorum RCEF 264]|uniref:Major facilitator superfamily domain, general substrate transporter n=1 Tax=Niveomyces insectorum RCEF 264 TaxID=1081102 RepID=A0A167N278_9HYPO|nr:Major facilitator superfamily domain, general substrate transporter [Niveomyces insectorum RCEF 264]
MEQETTPSAKSARDRKWIDPEKAQDTTASSLFGRDEAEADETCPSGTSEITVEEEEDEEDEVEEGAEQAENDEERTGTAPSGHAASAQSDIPDGGLTAWLQVLCAWVAMVDTWGIVNTFGVYQTYYETDLLLGKPGGASTDVSWIGSLQGSLLMLVGFLAGPLYDAGFFRHLIVGGMALIVFGQFMTSLCTAYWQLVLAQGVAVGVGMGLLFLPATAVLSQYFLRRRALAIGISTTGSPLAGIVFPILFSRLQPRIGFGWATRVIAFILLGLSVVPAVFMRPRVATGARAGASAGGATNNNGTTRRKRALFDASALREVPFVSMVVAAFASFLCLYVPFFFLQLFAQRRDIAVPAFRPFYLVTMLNVGSIFGRVLPNALADRIGSINVVLVCSATCAVLLFGWLGISSETADALVRGDGSGHLGGLVVFALLYGLFSGGIVGLMPSVIISLSPDFGRVGTRMGMVFFVSGLSLLIGPPIAGAILGDGSLARRWLGTIGFSAAGISVATVAWVISRVSLYYKKRSLRG